MNPRLQAHLFWGSHSPLSALTGAGLLVIASGRVAGALVCTAALVWVYAFTIAAAKLGSAYLPQEGKPGILLFLSALGSQIFMVILWIFSPVLALESSFFILLAPVVFAASGLAERTRTFDTLEALSQGAAEALVLGTLILALSLIREPLGFGSLSLPGLDSIRFLREEPLRILQVSSGALILLGYGTAVYRHFRNRYTNSEDD
ncbi:MAG: hypothetical protein LBC31_12625 [Treponema sp.]|nr:hypothetical protein [Treponema sp.]